MSDPDAAASGPALFREAALAHRYRKHWGRVPPRATGIASGWIALAAGTAVTAAALGTIGHLVGLSVLLP